MKKTQLHLIVMGLIAASLLGACKKENNDDNNVVFTANIETDNGNGNNKTYLIGSKIYWKEEDAITITNAVGQSHTFYLTEGKNTQIGRFHTDQSFSRTPDYNAVYPCGTVTTAGLATFTVGQTQDIGTTTGSFANGFMPMVARSSTNKLMFKNVFGGLCFRLTGNRHVSKIVLTSNNTNDKLYGTFTADCTSSNPLPTYVSGGGNSVELACDINLTATEQEFIIMMPPGTMSTGFTMTAYDGNSIIYNKSSNTTNAVIERSKIKNLSTAINISAININVSANPSNGGTVTGGGNNYYAGASCTVTATPATGYNFVSWTEGGVVVSNNASYTFMVTGDRTLVANFALSGYTVTVSANPTAGGTAYIGTAGTTQATFSSGASCIVSATANTGYRFTNWTEGGTVVSTNANYTISNIQANHTLVANFAPLYTITVSVAPTSSYGSASGGGTYASGTNCTVTASPSSYNEFVSWTENGTVVSTSASYTFTVTGNRTLVANFKPIGALKGQFYVGTWVWFSQGNLQYNNGATWRFATNQWDRIGGTAQYTSENTGARDIFGWARNGINHCGTPSNQNWHQPYTLGYYSGYYYCNVFTANGGHENNMSGTSDWGYNAISNGGNAANIGWRTLTSAEWTNLLNNQNWRTVYCNSVLGLLIYPYGVAATVSNGATIDATLLDNTGAVFLPVAGARSTGNSGWYWDQSSLITFRNSLRYNGSFSQVDYNTAGYYWSATSRTDWDWYYKYCLVFSSGNATVDYMRNMNGACVRLVKNR